MRCEQFRDDLLEQARRPGEGLRASESEAHRSSCAGCAAWFDAQRAVTDGLRALAESTKDEAPPDALEERLLAVFDAGRGGADPIAPPFVPPSRLLSPAWLLPAAAVLLLGVAGTMIWLGGALHTGPGEPFAAATPKVPTGRAEALPHGRSGEAAGKTETAPDQRRRDAAGLAEASVSQPSRVASAPVTSAVANRSGSGGRGTPQQAGVVEAEGFLPLPAAAGLPAFESGEIVRTDLPVTALPLYGVAIPPDAGDELVRVDFLVGQDGHPRAIRLVTEQLDARSRQ